MTGIPPLTMVPATMLSSLLQKELVRVSYEMMTLDDESYSLKIRRGVAMPLYVIALALSYLSDAIGKAAAAIAGDP